MSSNDNQAVTIVSSGLASNLVPCVLYNGGSTVGSAITVLTSPDGDGIGTNAQFNRPHSIVVDAGGGVAYISDQGSHRIAKLTISTSAVTFVCGSNAASGYAEGVCASAVRMNAPSGLALNSGTGVLYLIDVCKNQVAVCVSLLCRVLFTCAVLMRNSCIHFFRSHCSASQ